MIHIKKLNSKKPMYYKVAVQKNNYSKQFLFSTPFSSFGLPSLLLPSCSLTHFVGASATFAPRQDAEELGGRQFRHLSLGRYPLVLLASIGYYLVWGFVTWNSIAIHCQLFLLVGLKVVTRTEAFAFLTSCIANWPA